jgi:membrane-associated phospholipid phosphatase
MLSVTFLLDCIGYYAPLILMIGSIFLLQNKYKTLLVYIGGLILNNVLNAILKYAIKEPRPYRDMRILEIAIDNGERFGFDMYGMPSGHAQNCGFNLAFITLTLHNPVITTGYSVFTLLSLYQRYKYFNHTILQLIIGLIIGLLFGYLAYYVSNKWLKGNLKIRSDDFAPK